MESLKKLTEIIGSIPTAGALAAHISLLKDKLQFVLDDCAKLEKENASLIQKCTELEAQIASQSKTAEFVEHRGALFKRKPGGGYMDAPTCPVCHSAMVSFQDVIPFRCGKKSCQQQAAFAGEDLPKIMQELENT